ncbi:amino acid ABC transporter permease [Thalassospira lucentensis]|uniref:Amino acid ABC transporter permease n=1 Tax=Thalassospira lucentensis TaxID=168935 RepID=A0A358HMA6_9PROT|nr:amino acid ABC transporter permease [Thalassospira lucentensis]HBU96297.1 amino acid ABC transporter permease [Thalassospira lucentensis]HCW66017.1 amino acid ABC transporter permease [Thalassospira lucentensis]
MSEWFDFAIEHLPYVLQGIPTTLGLWASAMVIGAALGLVLAWARIYGSRPIYLAATIYVEIFRGTPMLVQMLFIYLGLPEIGIVFDPLTAAIIAIGLNTAAYQAEYFRGAVRSVPIGQMAAARALGMGQFQGFKNIILPQALRRVIPQWSNEAILELKYTSIAYAIGVTEITARAEKIGYETFQFFEVFLLIAAIYVVMTSVVAQVLLFVEKLVSVPGL